MTVQASDILDLALSIYPLPRSITGNAVRKTHDILRTVIPELKTFEVPTGTKCYDWTIPDEWNIEDAYIETLDGKRVIDWKDTNLHVVFYSTPVDRVMSREELFEHVHTREDMPTAVPYVTSYFNRRWGFCMSEEQKAGMTDAEYRVVIKSEIKPGSLTYGEILVPGETDEEILLHSYTCHPSMANNETSGVAVLSYLARYVLDMPKRHYSYRIVLVPETIGAVAYISRNLEALKARVKAGFVLTCVGDDRTYSFMPSRLPNTLPERVARHVLERVLKVDYKGYSFTERGSDERQYCMPGVDLSVVSIMRSKYRTYPEYHTSFDNFDVVTADGLWGGYTATKTAIDVMEVNRTYRATVLCEPMLGPRGLRPPLARGRDLAPWSRNISNILAYSDGAHDLLAIAEMLDCSIFDLAPLADQLIEQNLLVAVETGEHA